MSSTRPTDRKSLWTVRRQALPTILKPCPACDSTRHHPTGKFRVNANGKLLDVWLLVNCDRCGRTSKVPVHERAHVHSLNPTHLRAFETNDRSAVDRLAADPTLATRNQYRLDWTDTWYLDTDTQFYDVTDGTPLEVVVRFELPAPIRVEKLVTAGLNTTRPTARNLVAEGHLHLPLPLRSKARTDFTFHLTPPNTPPNTRPNTPPTTPPNTPPDTPPNTPNRGR
ncbi:DUF1062 domain-containing protein [Umezawaea sp.]|uniref:DUF1062 domain-containing protein n=1 Tax=Umezawaea sp. TaxID=1955258 RepID=UPI002ED4E447